MKLSTVLAIALCVAYVSAAPTPGKHHGKKGGNYNREDNYNREYNYNREDNSREANKNINQSIGSVGSSGKTGLLGGLLGGGILTKTTNNNYINQKASNN